MMTDEKLIGDFLEKNYKPVVYKNGLVFFEKDFMPKEKPGQLTYLEIKIILLNIFNYELENNNSVVKIFDEWYADKYKSVAKNIDTYLQTCKIKLGKNGFEVIDIDDQKISYKYLENKFISFYTRQFIKEIYNRWYVKAVNEFMKEYESLY